MTPLGEILVDRIQRAGPISVAEYMSECLLHPEHGYYTSRTSIGARGDFTTAPEISQMFGELMGACLIQAWRSHGSPKPFALLEMGPGKGTLMSDMLRVAQKAPEFARSAKTLLLEASPRLREVQRQALSQHDVEWLGSLGDLPEIPCYAIANEFFDALPICQLQLMDGRWLERAVGIKGGQLAFEFRQPKGYAPGSAVSASAGSRAFLETRPMADSIMRKMSRHIGRLGGMLIVIDYGNWGASADTLQAVRNHKPVDPLLFPGEADLTAHVDFQALAQAATGLAKTSLAAQGALLERLGITALAKRIARNLAGDSLESHIAAHRRLTHPEEMGRLFKAMAFHPAGSPPPPGFAHDS